MPNIIQYNGMAVILLFISSFFRMRCFHLDKASLVLKLCLPFFRADVEDEEAWCERLNSFYTSLAEAYQRSICNAVSLLDGKFVVAVGFSIVTDKLKSRYKRLIKRKDNVVIIDRYIRADNSLGITKAHHTDIIDVNSGAMIK